MALRAAALCLLLLATMAAVADESATDLVGVFAHDVIEQCRTGSWRCARSVLADHVLFERRGRVVGGSGAVLTDEVDPLRAGRVEGGSRTVVADDECVHRDPDQGRDGDGEHGGGDQTAEPGDR